MRTAFAQRRKTIRNNLKNTAADADLEAAGIAPAMRPEEIPPEKYVALSNLLGGRQPEPSIPQTESPKK